MAGNTGRVGHWGAERGLMLRPPVLSDRRLGGRASCHLGPSSAPPTQSLTGHPAPAPTMALSQRPRLLKYSRGSAEFPLKTPHV